MFDLLLRTLSVDGQAGQSKTSPGLHAINFVGLPQGRLIKMNEMIQAIAELNALCMIITMQKAQVKWHHALIISTISKVITETLTLPQLGTFCLNLCAKKLLYM